MKYLGLNPLLLMLVVITSFSSITNERSNTKSMYENISIGEQIWMKENLSVVKFRNGDFITHAKTKEQWIKAEADGTPAYCYFNNGSDKQSLLYNFYAVTDDRMLAPYGYRIPSKTDWDYLIKKLGGNEIAGLKLKSTSGWISEDEKSFNGSNESGFNAIPVGTRTADYKYGGGGEFIGKGETCAFWTSTIDNNIYSDGNQAFAYDLNNFSHKVGGSPYSYYMGCGFSVRCIKE